MAKKVGVVDASEFVTQAEAAGMRGVSLASINELVRRGRLTPVEMFGRNLLRRSDVLSFSPMKTGPKPSKRKRNRKPKTEQTHTASKRKASKKRA